MQRSVWLCASLVACARGTGPPAPAPSDGAAPGFSVAVAAAPVRPPPETACLDLWKRGLARENDLPGGVLASRLTVRTSDVSCDQGICTLTVDYRYRVGWYELELQDQVRADRNLTEGCTRLFMSGIYGIRELPTWHLAHPTRAEAVRAFRSAFDVEPRELVLVGGHPTFRIERVLGESPVNGRCGSFALDLVTGESTEAPRPCGPPTPRLPAMCGDDPHLGGRCRPRE